MEDYSRFLTNGLYIGIGGFLFFLLSRRTKYSVRVRSSAGEMTIWTTNDWDSAERIVIAINKAISMQATFTQAQAGEEVAVRH
jgi:hypothetical protein